MRSPAFTEAGRRKRARRAEERRLRAARAAVGALGLRAHRALRELTMLREHYADIMLDFGPLHLTARTPNDWHVSSWPCFVSVRLPEDLLFDEEILPVGSDVPLPEHHGYVIGDKQLLVCAALADEIGDALDDLDNYVKQAREDHAVRVETEGDAALYREAEARGRTAELADQLLEKV